MNSYHIFFLANHFIFLQVIWKTVFPVVVSSSASLLGCDRCEARWQQWVSTEDLSFVFIKNKGKHFVLGSIKALANISYQQCYFSWLGSSTPVPKLFEHFRPKSVMMDWAILSYTTNKFWAVFPEIVQLWSCKCLCAVDHRTEKRLLYSLRHNENQLQKEPDAWNNNQKYSKTQMETSPSSLYVQSMKGYALIKLDPQLQSLA